MYKDSSSTVRDFEETGGKTEEEEFLVCVNGFAILSDIKKGTSFFLIGCVEWENLKSRCLLLKRIS